MSTLLAGNSQSRSRPLKLNFRVTLMLKFIKIEHVFLFLTIFENTVGSLLAPPMASKAWKCEF